MAGRKLVATVHVDGVAYAAGSVPPADVAKRITNPDAWAKAEPETPAEQPEQPEDGDGSEDADGSTEPETPAEQPRRGKGK